MPVINRIARLFSADLNAVLDQIEEPAQTLRQAVRDMGDALAAGERREKALTASQQALARRTADIADRIAALDEELDLCFGRGKPELARSLVRRKLECQQLAAHIASQEKENAARLDAQRGANAEQRDALERLRQKAALFADREGTRVEASPIGAGWPAGGIRIDDDAVEVALLREQARRSAT